jgi:hypothetical protein
MASKIPTTEAREVELEFDENGCLWIMCPSCGYPHMHRNVADSSRYEWTCTNPDTGPGHSETYRITISVTAEKNNGGDSCDSQ